MLLPATPVLGIALLFCFPFESRVAVCGVGFAASILTVCVSTTLPEYPQ